MSDYGTSFFKPWVSVQNAVLAIAAIFLIAVMKLTSSELASWVQAIGSIAAIWGAFKIGEHQHQRHLIQRAEDAELNKLEVKKLVLRLAQDTYHQFSQLQHVLGRIDAGASASLSAYIFQGTDIRWLHLLDALKAVDIRELDGVQTMLVIDLKVACGFAIKLCDELVYWSGDSVQEDIMFAQVNLHTAKAEIAYHTFSSFQLK